MIRPYTPNIPLLNRRPLPLITTTAGLTGNKTKCLLVNLCVGHACGFENDQEIVGGYGYLLMFSYKIQTENSWHDYTYRRLVALDFIISMKYLNMSVTTYCICRIITNTAFVLELCWARWEDQSLSQKNRNNLHSFFFIIPTIHML